MEDSYEYLLKIGPAYSGRHYVENGKMVDEHLPYRRLQLLKNNHDSTFSPIDGADVPDEGLRVAAVVALLLERNHLDYQTVRISKPKDLKGDIKFTGEKWKVHDEKNCKTCGKAI